MSNTTSSSKRDVKYGTMHPSEGSDSKRGNKDPKNAILDLEEQAETHILGVLEAKRQRSGGRRGSNDAFRPAIPGERPPLGVHDSSLDAVFGLDRENRGPGGTTIPLNSSSSVASSIGVDGAGGGGGGEKRVTFGTLARKVMAMKQKGRVRAIDGHHRVASMLAKIDEDVNPLIAATAEGVDTATGTVTVGGSTTVDHKSVEGGASVTGSQRGGGSAAVRSATASSHKDNIQLEEFRGVALTDEQDLEGLHKVFEAIDPLDEVEEEIALYEEHGIELEPTVPPSSLVIDPTQTQTVNGEPIDQVSQLPSEQIPLMGGYSGHSVDNSSFQATWRDRLALTRQLRAKRFWVWWAQYNPWALLKWSLTVICLRSLLPLSLICAAIAWCLFYKIENPELDFLPGTATLSWWFNMAARCIVTFELSRFTQWIVIDCIALSSKFTVQLLGPFFTLSLIQSKGWPFVCGSWGIWNMILMHGDNPFQTHWLYWTDIALYTKANSGAYILNSDEYLRILLCLLFAGMAASAKRTIAGIYFGRKTFAEYKPKLETILNDIILISELAELAEEIVETLAMADLEDIIKDPEEEIPLDKSTAESEVSKLNASVNFAAQNKSPTNKKSSSSSAARRETLTNTRWSSIKFKKNESSKNLRDESLGDSVADIEMETEPSSAPQPGAASGMQDPAGVNGRPSLRRETFVRSSSKSSLRIKNLLDRWDEPATKVDKASESTIHDVLKFRKALTYMDLRHPFSVAFGPASTRDECIRSAQELYRRLLSLAPESNILSYEVIQTLILDAEGQVDAVKIKSMKKLFRPDGHNELTMVAFVQSCDTVYKKLRYFRASVANSSVIDRVLEDIIDGFFTMIVGMMLLSFLKFDPWRILVSLSTLLVTFTFAVGPSTAKVIEGILMIIGRRPFDIGDRIVFAAGADAPNENAVSNSWFVEDISLFTTTLRFAATNEVASVSNASIAASRILNCQRSPNAVVNVILRFHVKIYDNMGLELFRESLDGYVMRNPSVWDCILFFRLEDIDANALWVTYRLGMRTCHSWQDTPRILRERAELRIFCHKASMQLHIHYGAPMPMQKVILEDGRSEESKAEAAAKSAPRKTTADNNFLSFLQQSHG